MGQTRGAILLFSCCLFPVLSQTELLELLQTEFGDGGAKFYQERFATAQTFCLVPQACVCSAKVCAQELLYLTYQFSKGFLEPLYRTESLSSLDFNTDSPSILKDAIVYATGNTSSDSEYAELLPPPFL